MKRSAALVVGGASALQVAVAASTGLGDGEALYASYARHLQAGYLDHPPLVGWIIAGAVRLAGATPFAVRLPAIALFLVSAILVGAITRRLGGSDRAVLLATIVYVAVPELLASGVVASPDAPLAAALLLMFFAILRAGDAASSRDWLTWTLVAGLAAGAALLAKYSAAFLLPGVILWGGLGRRRLGPVVVLAVAAAMFLPVLFWNSSHGWASALHRLVWTQEGIGPSFRNLGGLVGGQLAYVSPVALVGLGWVARRGVARGAPPRSLFLAGTSVVALALGYALCLVSRVAEPHWPAPGYLGLVPLLGIALDGAAEKWARRLLRVGLAWSGAVVTLLLVAIWTPALVLATPRAKYDGRLDLTNDLRGWPAVAAAVRRVAPPGPPVVAFHYTTCSQVAFALGREADRVYCLTEEVDDYDLWGRGGLPPGALAVAIEDPRFAPPEGRWLETERVVVRRGGRVVRRFSIHFGRLSSTPRGAGTPRRRSHL